MNCSIKALITIAGIAFATATLSTVTSAATVTLPTVTSDQTMSKENASMKRSDCSNGRMDNECKMKKMHRHHMKKHMKKHMKHHMMMKHNMMMKKY